MASYDSDDSMSDEELGSSTNVLLGYASTEPVDDPNSHLGGTPEWLDSTNPPSYAYSRCKSCSSPMPLLLQLNADLPERFAGHERRLYVWACRQKRCRRKPGSIRALRNVRATVDSPPPQPAAPPRTVDAAPSASPEKPNLGAQLFGGSGLGMGAGNPFSSAPGPSTTTSADPAADLPATFADKARIAAAADPPPAPKPQAEPAHEPWPSHAESKPHTLFHLDADYEYLSAAPAAPTPAHTAAFLDAGGDGDDAGGAAGAPDDRIDRAFQHFADTLAQNPEQVLRYDFAGPPLLYRRDDAVGRALHGKAGMPACGHCKRPRVLEVQLTPGAIAALERDASAAEVLDSGMEWGTVIVGVCGADCCGAGGEAVAREEWVGVQWEEVVDVRADAAAATAAAAAGGSGAKGKGKAKEKEKAK